MSNTLRITLKCFQYSVKTDLLQLMPTYSQTARTLYAKSTLGIPAFEEHRKQTKIQMENIEQKFRDRMTTYTLENDKSMIFTEDLKNMIHIAEDDSDFELVVKMTKKFNGQNKQLRFGNFIFGPVVMRLFHLFNKPTIAVECFKSPECIGMFDQLITYQILLDLLYENGKYNEVIEVFEIIRNKQLQSAKFPKNAVVLVMAACYKLNSEESVKYALKLWNDLMEAGHLPMRRTATFCAGLVLNQGKPDIALEILSSIQKGNYMTVRNLKVKALTQIGRLDDAVALLKAILAEERTREIPQTFNRDILLDLEQAVQKSENTELLVEFNRLKQLLEKEGHVTDTNLDAQLCSEIQQPPVMNNREFNKYGKVYSDKFRYKDNTRIPQRPGLTDMI